MEFSIKLHLQLKYHFKHVSTSFLLSIYILTEIIDLFCVSILSGQKRMAEAKSVPVPDIRCYYEKIKANLYYLTIMERRPRPIRGYDKEHILVSVVQSFKGAALTYQLFCFLVEMNTRSEAKLDWKKDDYSSVLPSFSTEAVSKQRINSLYFLRQLRKTFTVCCQGTLIPLHSAQRCTCSNIFGSWGLHTVPFMH